MIWVSSVLLPRLKRLWLGQPASGAPVLNGQVSGSDVLLSWTQVPGSLGYQIYRDGLPIDGVPGEANTAYVDQSLADGTYAYAVSAIDSGGQEGDLSNIVLLTVDTGGGGGGVGIPQNVTAVGSTTQALISLSWTQGPGDTPVGYLVVRSLGGVFDFQPIANVTTTNYDDTTVGNGVAYDYFIVAQDDVGGFSDPSDTVTATATFTVAPPAAPVYYRTDHSRSAADDLGEHYRYLRSGRSWRIGFIGT